MRYHPKKRQHNYQIKRTSIKDINIDRQILAIHSAIADKIIHSPDLINQVKKQLEERKLSGRLTYAQYMTWFCILDLIDQPIKFRQALLEDTPKMNQYRRKTPFTGILTEQERQAVLEEDILGYTQTLNAIIY